MLCAEEVTQYHSLKKKKKKKVQIGIGMGMHFF